MHIDIRLGRRGVMALAGVVAALAVAGTAYATIPDAGGVFTACKLNGLGTVRLIDPSGPSSSWLSHCTAFETQVSWNQKGPKGDTGPAGLTGANGANGASPTVSPLTAGDSHCPAGGAAITDAAGTVAYVCSGQNGANGADGQPFAGRFASPDGNYSLSVTNDGVDIVGPDTKISVSKDTGIMITSNSNVTVEGHHTEVVGDESLTVRGNKTEVLGSETVTLKGDRTEVVGNANTTIVGAHVGINAGTGCRGVAAVGDLVQVDGPGPPFAGGILTGSPTVCID